MDAKTATAEMRLIMFFLSIITGIWKVTDAPDQGRKMVFLKCAFRRLFEKRTYYFNIRR